LTEIFRDFRQSLQVNAAIVHPVGERPPPSKFLVLTTHAHFSVFIQRYEISAVKRMFLNNARHTE